MAYDAPGGGVGRYARPAVPWPMMRPGAVSLLSAKIILKMSPETFQVIFRRAGQLSRRRREDKPKNGRQNGQAPDSVQKSRTGD
eukprot:1090897-Prymnesium_polylepis.1